VVAPRLREIARLFLTVGVVGVGGPAAHVALMHDQVVRRRAWLNDAEFVALVGATALVPGPNSTELAMAIGHRRAGARGLAVAGASFIVPAVAIVAVIAWAYARYGTLPASEWIRYGTLPAVVAIVAVALVRLAPVAAPSPVLAASAVAAAAASVAGVHDVVALVVAGLLPVAVRGASALWCSPLLLMAAIDPRRILAVFAMVGSLVYGSGYVLLALLERELVERRGWIDERTLLDAVAVGQVTPGPVFSTATFIGWQVGGPWGAAAATVGIFAPSVLFVAAMDPLVRAVDRRPALASFLSGVGAAAVGLMAVVLVRMAGAAVADGWTAGIAAASVAVLLRTRVNSAWVVVGGCAVGAAVRLVA
jgi:chromate transporter